ncbi:MAG: primosomal replication protein N [Pusillimonas sp.]|nr:primosomal replication protein N [Pusillimonas sp.]
MNHVSLQGSVIEVAPLRHTPAGVPVLEILLEHQSVVNEAGNDRQINMLVSAVALGDTALMLHNTPLGTHLQAQGFLAPSRKGSTKFILHIQQASRRYPGDRTVEV